MEQESIGISRQRCLTYGAIVIGRSPVAATVPLWLERFRVNAVE
jgi:hypothetical protein